MHKENEVRRKMMQIKCRKCGKVYPYERIVCPKCGYDMTEDEELPIRDQAYVRQLKKMKEERLARGEDITTPLPMDEKGEENEKEKQLKNTIRIMAVMIILLIIAIVSMWLIK